MSERPFEFTSPFERLVDTTDEYTSILPQLFETELLPRLAKTERLLDVGAGPGLVTDLLSGRFTEVTVVEPDPSYCLEAVRKALQRGLIVTAFNGTWESAPLAQQAFDLIVCAHVLYFVPHNQWRTFIEKMVPFIAPGGRMAVMLVARSDATSERIRRSLGFGEPGLFPFSAAVIDIVQTLKLPFEVLSAEASLEAGSAAELEQMLPLFPVMNNDAGSTLEQRLEMIEAHFRTGDRYRLPYTVDAVLVSAVEEGV